MTKTLEKAFEQAAKLPVLDQDVFAKFLLEELAFRDAVQVGIEAADRGDVVPLEDVKKMIPKWASRTKSHRSLEGLARGARNAENF